MILQWLLFISPPLPFEEKQHEMFQVAKRAPGAGKWLLGSQQFTDWRDGESRKLWCYGIRKNISFSVPHLAEINTFTAGAGKTVLAYDKHLSPLPPWIRAR